MYKLIALDMDGTILKNDTTISERTKNAVKLAKQCGIKVVLASGRPMEAINNYLEELELISEEDFVLSYNGAIVQNTGTKEKIVSNLLTGKDAHILYKLSLDMGVDINGFSKLHGLVAPRNNIYIQIQCDEINKALVEMDFYEIKEEDEITKIIMTEDAEVLSRGIELIPDNIYEEYTVLKSDKSFLEFLNKDSNKGKGLEYLANHLGITREEIISVGDAENDKHMIEFAGLGVAMGNASDDIKKIADYIAPTNEEDGVAHIIERFILANNQ
jgi:HAD-superfamily hydrolase, subfamily IIB